MDNKINGPSPVYEINLPAQAWPAQAHPDTPPLIGQTQNVCQGSLRLVLDSAGELKVDDAIRVGLDAGEQEDALTLSGIVRWVRTKDDGCCELEAGIQLGGDDLVKWVMFLDRLQSSGRCLSGD